MAKKGPKFGHEVSAATRAKISAALKGRRVAEGSEFRKGFTPWNKGTRQYTEHVCEGCGKEFQLIKGHAGAADRRFCTRACKIASVRGTNHHNWRGGRWQVKSSGYMMNQCPIRKRAYLEHHIIAERVLGRKMKREELVHHLNADKADNDNRNLLICTIGYHRSLERRMSEMWQREHFPNYRTDVASAG
jgi:hypothetical protein